MVQPIVGRPGYCPFEACLTEFRKLENLSEQIHEIDGSMSTEGARVRMGGDLLEIGSNFCLYAATNGVAKSSSVRRRSGGHANIHE
jgi:hypothetical protein